MAINFPDSPTSGQVFTSGTSSWTYDGVKWNLNTNTTTSNDSMPVGSIMWYSTTTTPTGWLPADGSAVSRTTYATLFALISTTYGVGDGSTTFNVPSVASTTGKYFIRYTTSVGTVTTTSLATSPVGTMFDWPTTSSYPTGFLACDGSAVSRTSYADLFALIGTTYGSGDGSTTFNLPNLVAAGTGSPVKIIKASLGGTVEPSTVAHAASHIRGGSDVIDGDRVQVDYVPTRYTRDSSDSNAGANTDITSHLKGIDNNFNNISRLAYQSTTTSYSTATSAPASAANVFATSLTFTANGTSAYIIEAYAPRMNPSLSTNDYISAILYDVGNNIALGCIGFCQTPTTNATSSTFYAKIFITPSAGSKSYNLRFVHGSSSGIVGAGSGGTGSLSYLPMYMAVYGPGI